MHQKYLRALIGLSAVLLGVFAAPAAAERLPIRTYTVADGLPNDHINRIVRDPRGFLWFCTSDGLSRFDGYTFVNYGMAEGLPHAMVMDLLITRDGQYWLATWGGLVRFNPHGTPMFTVYAPASAEPRARRMTRAIQRRDGTIWAAARNGVMRLARAGAEYRLEPVEMNLTGDRPVLIETILEDRHDTLWIGTSNGLYRRWNDGYVMPVDRSAPNYVNDLLEDRQGRLWVASRSQGFFSLATTAGREAPVVTTAYRTSNGFIDWVFDLYETSDARLYAATNRGLLELGSGGAAAPARPQLYTKRHGFTFHEIEKVTEDGDGNLWLGTTQGVMKIARDGFLAFDERDSLYYGPNAIFESVTGDLRLVGWVRNGDAPSRLRIGQFDGERFTWVSPGPRLFEPGWGDQPLALQTRSGELWLASVDGVSVFPPVRQLADYAKVNPIAVYTARDGLMGPMAYTLFEDSRGDVWLGTVGDRTVGVARWDHATRSIQDMSATPGLPPLTDKWPVCFEEDRSGNVWLGLTSGGLTRYSAGRFTTFTTADGVPAGKINDLHLDRQGRLWVATSLGGISRIDDAGAIVPKFFTYTIETGLSSNVVVRIAEDRMGRIYAGGGRGVDQIAPATNRIRHYTAADGLPAGEVSSAFTDRSGALWFGTLQGLSRMIPKGERQSSPAPIWISGLRVAGERQTVSALGESAVVLPNLSADRNQLEIQFVGVSFAPGETLRYQYRLEGAANKWSAPSDQRTVHLAGLAPGTYTFEVRALNADRVSSPTPARVTFTILAPIWQRPWFAALSMLVVGVLLYGAYSYRVSRLLELERVRTRIASDLHDDIGAALSRIAVLSEVARLEAGGDEGPVPARLSVIASASREVLDSMNDIVWAINPTRDQLRDLIQRMRRFASDVFTARAIAFTFHAPQDERPLHVTADVRRHVFLVFKEAVNNVVRHSGATEADVDIRVDGSAMTLTVADNGRGFDPARTADGHGLASMTDRASMMGGRLDVTSHPGGGTTIRLTAPLNAAITEHNRRLHRTQRTESRAHDRGVAT